MRKKLSGLGIIVLGMSIAGTALALTPMERLGQSVYRDKAFSSGGNQSCQTCHHPNSGFADPVNRRTLTPVSMGSDLTSFGGRNAPPAAYAAYSPPMFFDGELFIGGVFWDGRASGTAESATAGLGAGPTYDPLADQSKGPFLNPVEMNLSSVEEFITIFKSNKKYVKLYSQAFGTDVANHTPATAYNNIAMSISAFEKSNILNKFTSKFDAFRAEQELAGIDVSTIQVGGAPVITAVFTAEQVEGLRLFNTEPGPVNGGGGCFLCHPVPAEGAGPAESVFTDFSYDNLGIPVNPDIALFAGPQKTDYGLGAQVAILQAAHGSTPPLSTSQLPDGLGGTTEVVDGEEGKFKVSSLRNIAVTAPYGHNGYFLTLWDIVHFYNTRDVADAGWPAPEVPSTVNDAELGNLGLTFEEEMSIVAFLETLTDL